MILTNDSFLNLRFVLAGTSKTLFDQSVYHSSQTAIKRNEQSKYLCYVVEKHGYLPSRHVHSSYLKVV